MKKVFVRAPYNYDADEVSNETGFACTEPSMAQQSFKDECDINKIMERFGLTGELPDNVRIPQYGDFSGIRDYHSALNAVLEADEAFMQLPAQLRARFDNDPAKFVDFCSDDSNRDEAVKLGLLSASEAPQSPSNGVSEGSLESPKAPE